MLTVFVVESGADNADAEATVRSVLEAKVPIDKVVYVNHWNEINSCEKGDWFCVLWDNERLSTGIQDAIKEHLKNPRAEVLIIYKRLEEKKASYRPRFMRRSIWLKEDYCPISNWVYLETVLDGWILEHE